MLVPENFVVFNNQLKKLDKWKELDKWKPDLPFITPRRRSFKLQSKVISLLLNAEEYRISKAKLSQRNDHYFIRVGKLCHVYEIIAYNSLNL